jgi:predicted RNase H-like HicB family nuclease
MTISRRTLKQNYPIEVFWSDEDGVWIANVPELVICSGHGDTPHAAVEVVEKAVEAWLEVAKREGLNIPTPSRKSLGA